MTTALPVGWTTRPPTLDDIPARAARLYFGVGMTPLYRAGIFQTEI